MNAFAAQVVLSVLKPPELDEGSVADSHNTLFGLPAFLKMTAAERANRFGHLLGGPRLLTHVSAVLDADWTLLQP